jgi:hypothetical protein
VAATPTWKEEPDAQHRLGKVTKPQHRHELREEESLMRNTAWG